MEKNDKAPQMIPVDHLVIRDPQQAIQKANQLPQNPGTPALDKLQTVIQDMNFGRRKGR